MMFAAAAVSDDTLRDTLISQLHSYASSSFENQPFEIVYNPTSGHQTSGALRSDPFVISAVETLIDRQYIPQPCPRRRVCFAS